MVDGAAKRRARSQLVELVGDHMEVACLGVGLPQEGQGAHGVLMSRCRALFEEGRVAQRIELFGIAFSRMLQHLAGLDHSLAGWDPATEDQAGAMAGSKRQAATDPLREQRTLRGSGALSLRSGWASKVAGRTGVPSGQSRRYPSTTTAPAPAACGRSASSAASSHSTRSTTSDSATARISRARATNASLRACMAHTLVAPRAGAVLATFGDWHENRCSGGELTRPPRSPPAMRLLVVTAFTLRLLGAGAPIDPRGPPALPGSRQKAVLRRQVSDEPSGAPTKVAIFAMGRFWCAEPVFARLHGVISTEVGYTGGWKTDPTYEDVHDPPKGQPSGHAFAVRIGYDPGHITLKMLLEVFFDAHGEWC